MRAAKLIPVWFILLCFSAGTASAACEVLKVSFAENWYPISYYDDNENPIGIALDIHKEIFSKLNVKAEFIGNIPWARQLKKLEAGETDALAALNFNQERAEKYILTDHFHTFNARLFALNETEHDVLTVQDLVNYNVAYSRGASFGPVFDQLAKDNDNFIPVNGTRTMIDVLIGGRTDFFVLPTALGTQLAKKYNVNDRVKITGPIIHSQDVHMAFSRKSLCSGIVAAYNVELSKLKKNGFVYELYKKYMDLSS